MGYHCTAGEECTCPIWDHGKIKKVCIEKKCRYLSALYNFRICNCGTRENPLLYGQGIAKQYINENGEKTDMCFSDFDGYVVECSECGAITRFARTPEKAVELWNKEDLEYAGESCL